MDSQSCFSLLCFTFSLLFFTFSLFLFFFLFRSTKQCCRCDICQAYVTSSWTSEFNNLCDWYTHLLRESPTGTIHIHVLGNVITSNPMNVEHILKTKFDNYPKGKKFSAILGDLLGKGIFNVDGDSWKFQRKMASLELGSVSIRSYAFETVKSEISSRLIPLLLSVKSNLNSTMKSTTLDLQDVFQRFSFDSICKFSFGFDPGCLNLSLPVSDLALAFDLASKLSAGRAMTASPIVWKIKRLLNVGSERKLADSIKSVNLIADKVIKHKRDMGSAIQQDLLGRFMNSISDDAYLRDIIKSFLLAGRDTVASALTSFFWLLANHPEVESAIRVESDRIMGKNEEIASFEQMRELHYLQGALYESMRLYPPVQFDSKFCQKDDVLPDGTFVQQGTRVTYHPYAMGRMETIWGSDCLEFKPQRWLQNGVFKHESPFKYPVFQGGLRVCLGKELALVEMKSVALALIRRFDIRPTASSKALRFAPGLSATLSGGLPVVVQERMKS